MEYNPAYVINQRTGDMERVTDLRALGCPEWLASKVEKREKEKAAKRNAPKKTASELRRELIATKQITAYPVQNNNTSVDDLRRELQEFGL